MVNVAAQAWSLYDGQGKKGRHYWQEKEAWFLSEKIMNHFVASKEVTKPSRCQNKKGPIIS
jgi:hypothetical protein